MFRSLSNSQKSLLRIKTFSIPLKPTRSGQTSIDLKPSKPVYSCKSPTFSPSVTLNNSISLKISTCDSSFKQISSKTSKSPTILQSNPLFSNQKLLKSKNFSKNPLKSKRRVLKPSPLMMRLQKKTKKSLIKVNPEQKTREIFKNWDLDESFKVSKPLIKDSTIINHRKPSKKMIFAFIPQTRPFTVEEF